MISACRIEFNHYKREFTVLQYSTAISSIIISFCVIFDICYMMNLSFYIYSRILPVIISACRIEFNHYKTWIYSITVFYNTLKLNHIILYHIWYLQYIKLPFYIYIPEYSQYWFQHAALNLNSKSSEFTLLQYSTTLLSLITSFCIIFDICNMSNLPFYIYSWTLPVLISKCCIEFNHYKTWIYSITVFYNTLKLNHIILYHIWYLQYIKLPFYIYIPEYSQYWFQHAALNLITKSSEFTLLQYSTTLLSLITSFCIIFDICNMMKLPFYIYSRILPVLISTCWNQFNQYKTWIYSISEF